MALNDIEHRDEAARRLTARLSDLEEQAQENGWLWVLVARGYSDLAIVESERGREAAGLEAIKASKLAVKQVRAGGRNQWVNAAEQTIAIANSLSHLGSYADAIEMLQMLVNELEQRLEESEDQGAKLLLFEAFNDLGLIAHACARHDQAEDAYGQALALGASADPNSVLSHKTARMLINRAAALTEAHQFDRALKSIEKAEGLISPSDGVWTDYLNNRAAVLTGLGKTTEALRLFRDAYDAADDDEDRHRAALNIAVSLVELERWAEARDTAHQVISETQGAVFGPEGVGAVTLYFWIASRIIASRAAAFVCVPNQALQETREVLAALEEISSHLGPDRVQLHGYALEAVGDAFAAVGDRQAAEQSWSDAEHRFEASQSRLWQKEIARLQQKCRYS
jgi:tetratricopeptide (TPR) repeat protein